MDDIEKTGLTDTEASAAETQPEQSASEQSACEQSASESTDGNEATGNDAIAPEAAPAATPEESAPAQGSPYVQGSPYTSGSPYAAPQEPPAPPAEGQVRWQPDQNPPPSPYQKHDTFNYARSSRPQGQYTPPQGQYAPPQAQYAPPQGQYAPPQAQYAPPQGQYAPPQGQYVPPQGQYAPPEYTPPVYKSAGKYAKLALGFTIAAGILSVALGVFGYGASMGMIQSVIMGREYTPAILLRFVPILLLGLLSVAASIGASVFQALFTYRASKNVEAMGIYGKKISAGWAVGSLFIPYVNLVMPYLTYRELWQLTAPGYYPAPGITMSKPSSGNVTVAYVVMWASSLIGVVLSFITSFIGSLTGALRSNVYGDFSAMLSVFSGSYFVTIITATVSAVASVLIARMLYLLWVRQDEKAAEMGIIPPRER